jgi:EAL and modified HD-GYP domain-containing signal transduction protein
MIKVRALDVAVDETKDSTGEGRANANIAKSLIGRQPILDRLGRVRAYELLFRGDMPGDGRAFDGNYATANVIANALTEFEFEGVVGPHQAFINFTEELLQDDTALLLPKDRVVLEILEDVNVTRKLIKAAAALAAQGYHIALDDFVFEPQWEPLIVIAGTVKLDVTALSRTEIEQHVKTLRRYDVRLLAEKVEDADEHAWLMELGFDLFQGYYYAKPNIVSRTRIPQNHLAVVRLLAALNRKSAPIGEIEKLVSEDVALSYRLLRYINSAFIALPQKIDSIQRAVIYLGIDMLRHWASLLVMAGVDGKPKVLMENALVRARMCERLAAKAGLPDAESFFTVGLFSILDSLLDTPMETLLEPLPLSPEIVEALTTGAGVYGEALRCVASYETCDWANVKFRSIEREAIGGIYLDSIGWAFEAASGL